MSWIDELFGGGRQAAAGAMNKELGQGLSSSQGLFSQGQGYLNPFIQREPGQYQAYIDALNQSQDPMKLYNQFASSYKESPEALAQTAVGQKAASGAAASSGMLGSGAEQTAAANLAQSTRATDFDKYMANMFGIRNQYLGGYQGLQGQGFQAAGMGANLSAEEAQMQQKYYEDMANAQAAQKEAQSQGWTNMIGQGIGLAGDIFGMPGMGGGGNTGGSWLNPDTGRTVNY